MFDTNDHSYGDAEGPTGNDNEDDEEEEQNSLVTSMNGAANPLVPYRRMVPQAPLVSQMSDNEDEELERIIC